MRILKSLLPLLVLLLWSTTAKAQYNPTDPPEPGVNFTLTTRCIPAEAGYSISGAGSHAFGSNVSMSVRTTTGYRFICWEDEDGTEVSTTTDFTYVMPTKNVTLTARFEYDPTSPSEPSTPEFKDTSRINIEINPSEAGYLSSGSAGEYETGSVQRFAVRNNSYYRFVNWTLNGIEIGTSTTLDFTVPSGDQTLVANFAYDPDSPAEPSVPSIPHTLTLQTNLAGAATLSGGGNHEPGTNVSVNANANTYYHFINWTDDEGTVVSEASRFTYTMPNHHVKLTANYTYDYDPTSPGEPGTPNPDNTITENMVLWPRMGMYDDTHVQILCETPGATIHYTLDGTEPNAESPVYTEPVFVASNLLVRAIAYKEGMDDSPIVSYQVTVYKAEAPVFTFENRKIIISSETPDAIIRYTLDFTNPNAESEVFTTPFEPEENCRIKAYASKEGLTDSPISVFVFRKADYTLQAPTFSIDEDGRLVIIPAVEGGQTYYTLDGSDPSSGSALYSEPLLLEGNFKIKAFTLHPNYYDSLIGEYSMGGFQVETPTFSYADLALTMATATSQAILRYTLDGTIPSEESAQYTAPLRLTEDCKVVARGFKENYEPSDTVSYSFILADHKAAAPVMTYDPEALTVTMSCPTQDAEIRYSVDGEAPTATTGIRYEGPVTVVGNHTYTAVAFRSDLFASDPSSVTVDDQKVPTPTASFANKLLTLSCTDADAEIHYTTDGNAPTSESALYSEPLTLREDCTVRFFAIRENFNDSEANSYVFVYAEHQVATPVLNYDRENLLITISTATEGAEIRYTIDGSVPTAETGTIYTEPIAVVGNHTFTARAFLSTLFDSSAATYTVDDQTVPTPIASFADKHLTLSCSDPEARIHYTIDGSEPTPESALYSEPLALTEDCTVRFIGVRESFNDSEPDSFAFVYADHQVATPMLEYDSEARTMTMSCATPGALIRYTNDGTEPTATTGTEYTATFEVVGNQTFKAIAVLDTLFDSEVAEKTVDDQTVPTPTASFANKHLTLTCADPEARIYYTTDASAPTTASTPYSGPIALTEDRTVRFIGVRDRFNDSEPGSFAFVYADHQVATPMLEYDSEARTMTMSCATPGALIRYTNDGTEPTATTGTEYTATFEVVGNQTFKAIALLDTLFDSEVAERMVDDQTVPTPTASFANKHLTLTCADPEARIYYTTDASAPTTASTPYSGPVALTEDCTVRFIGVRDRFNDSEPGSFAFVYADHQVATPILEYDSEARTMTMSCATPGALIRYTNDGTEPTATTGTEYTATFEVVGNQTFKAIAVLDTLFDSEVAERTVDDQTVPTPTASFANKHLTLTCADPEAQILYTTERETVRAEWTPYTAPIALTQNCIVNFYATRENFNNSDTGSYQFLYTEHQVATPRFDYNRERKQITITCDTLGAEIRYTTDGSDPTSTSGTVYAGPIAVVGNHIFTARAFRSDLFDSEKESLTVDDQNTAKPYASFSDRQLTLICADSQAQIRYTTDGNAPTQTSALYERPIAMNQDCVVRYTAFLDDFNPTEGDPFKFVYTEWQVATPELSYDTDGKQMTIRCATEGAVIRYTIDAEAPTATTGIEYNGTFDVIGNHIYRARAFMNGLFDSEAATYTVTNQTVPTPVALYSGHHVALSCPDPEARILYSIETRSSMTDAAIYSSPIPVDRDCVIRFHAYREYFNDSEEDVFEFKIADYTETEPVMNFRYRDREIEITHSGNLPVAVTINGVQQTMPTPATVSVTPVMTEISAYTPAQNDDRYDSRTSSDTIVFHSEPIISFDNRKTVSLSHGEDDPYADSVTFDVRIDRGETSFTSDTIEIDGFAYVTATAKSDSAFRSQPANLRIDHYNTGSEAGARNGHRLAEAFPENSDRENCNELRVTGEMNREDFLFIGSLPNLTSLDLAPDSMNDDLDGVFAESSIKTVTSTVYPEGMLKGMPKLTTVIWNNEDKMPDGRIAEAGNPNILFWTSDRRFAPADAVNIVTATDEDTEGHAESITLQTGYPFNAYRPFRADKAEVTKTFSLPTEIGICAGWETIALPFTPDSVIHETAGRIVPYTVWDGPEDSAKPFWLYYATEEDWVEADTIVAGTPYIISMPNNEEYVNGYSLPGRVTFAGADVDFANTDSLETATRWKEGATFIGTFMPVEEQGIRSLNVNVAAGLDWLGSAFVDEDVTLPFGAYMYGSNLPSQIPVFGDWSGIITPTADTNYGIKVETPAPGMIRISSGRAATVTIVTPEGAVIRTLRLQPGESQCMEGLTRGLYIAGGKKVMVR